MSGLCSILSFKLGDKDQRSLGLVAFVSLLVTGPGSRWRIDATVRRTGSGRYALSFPARRDRDGKSHLIAGPIDAATRAEVERLVLQELGFDGEPAAAGPHEEGGAHA